MARSGFKQTPEHVRFAKFDGQYVIEWRLS